MPLLLNSPERIVNCWMSLTKRNGNVGNEQHGIVGDTLSTMLDHWVLSGKRLQQTNWRITMLFMGKSTISTGPWLQVRKL